MRDPRTDLQEALEQIRGALRTLRDSVVDLVMRRDLLKEEAEKLDTLIAALESKAAFAEKNQAPILAAELRQELESRRQERERLRAQLTTAVAEAEAAKARLPEQEAQLLQQARSLQAQYTQLVAARLDTAATPLDTSDAGELWNRATAKLQALTGEADARAEVAGVSSAPTGAASAPRNDAPPVPSAEEMLRELEARVLGQTENPPISAPPASLATEMATAGSPETTPATPPEPPTPNRLENNQPASAMAAASPQVLRRTKGDFSPLNPTQRVRVAGIGTGGIFRGAHLPAYLDIPQMQLVALCDPDKEAQDLAYKRMQSLTETKIQQARERHDIAAVERLERDLEEVRIVEDISQVIAEIPTDICDICTQPFLHVPLSIQALEAGINVMCEKPISRSWLETERLIPAIQRSGKLYQHNENWLWDADYYTAKKLVDAGAIGEPILMFLAQAHGGPEGNGKFWNPHFGGGGALLDNGIHAIGAAWFVCGLEKVPTLVKAAEPFGMSIRMPDRIIDGRFQKVTVDDDAHILIRFEDPQTKTWATAHVEGSWSERDSPETAVIGTTGKIVFKREENVRYAVVLDAYDRETRRLRVSGPTWQHWPSSHYGEILNFVECVRHGVPSICTAEFGADNSAIVGASYLSEKRGKQPVHIEEFKAFAREIAAKYPNDPTGADNALVDALLAALARRLAA
jgi:predicted dehydrogenase/phage shock protein A